MKLKACIFFIAISLIIMAIPLKNIAQTTKNLKTQKLIYSQHFSTTRTSNSPIDSLYIIPTTFKIWTIVTNNKKQVDTTFYSLNFENNLLTIQKKLPNDTFFVQYRTLPLVIQKKIYNKAPELIQKIGDQPVGGNTYYEYAVKPKQNGSAANIFNFNNGIDYNGSLSRGITFGNQQDISVNSNFNMQMQGMLPNGVQVTASLTDNNIPFQPEGNTQQLQDFDRIFIQFKKNNTTLLLGDYDLPRPTQNYFVQYTRKLQGAMLTNNFKVFTPKKTNQKKTTPFAIQNQTSAAVARGTYYRLTIAAQEGNQGPYKLTGANNELFIMVLSGTERVFVDGRQLARGAENDYIIDYNTAELLFTPKTLITKDIRIIAEYQYTNQNYLRTTLTSNWQATTANQKISLNFHFFSEQDAKNQPLIAGTLSPKYLHTLQQAGDTTANAIIPAIEPTNYEPNQILYALIADTIVAGIHYDSVYVQSNNPQKQLYRLAFSMVGNGNGNYVLQNNTLNGRVYKWTAPDSITLTKLGNFEPIIQLIAPKKQQIMGLAATFQPSKNEKIALEVAFSNKDANTFSAKNDNNNKALAYRTFYQKNWEINQHNSLNINTQYEYVNRFFEPLENFRNVEFTRDWNLTNKPAEKNNEYALKNQMQWQYKKKLTLFANFNYFQRGKNQYKGKNYVTGASYKNAITELKAQISYLNSIDSVYNTQYIKPQINAIVNIKNFQLGSYFLQEYNQFWAQKNDSLTPKSFYFNEINFFLKQKDTTNNAFNVFFTQRKNWNVKNNMFNQQDVAQTWKIQGALNKNLKNQLQYSAQYRTLIVKDSVFSSTNNIKNSNTLLTEITHNATVKNGFIRTNTQYQIASGQEQKNEYYYQKVDAGRGNFVWKDYNGNGLEDLIEFEPAGELDLLFANYVRTLLPTNEYQKTNSVQITQTLNIQPKIIFINSQKKIQKLLNYISWQSTLFVNRKYIQPKNFEWQNLWLQKNTQNTASENINIFNALYINRNSSTWETNMYNQYQSNATLLLGGTDTRTKTEQGNTIKIQSLKKITLQNTVAQGIISSTSTVFFTRNFNIKYYKLEPAFIFQPNTQWQFNTTYMYKKAHNEAINTQHVTQQKLSAEARFGAVNKSTFSIKISYIALKVNNLSISEPQAYTLLEGLQAGNNYVWSCSFNAKLANNMYLNIGYDGKKNNVLPANHVGRASVRAVF